MAPTTRKRKAANAGSGEKAIVASSRAKGAKANGSEQNLHDKETDEGRSGSRNFFQAAKTSKRQKVNPKAAEVMIQQQSEELVSFIDGFDWENKTGTKLSDRLSTTISPETARVLGYAKNPKLRGATSSTLGSPIHAIHDVLERRSQAIEIYKKLARRKVIGSDYEEARKSIGSTLASYKKNLKLLNEDAKVAAGRTAASHIIPNPKSSLTRPPARASKIEKMAWEIFEDVNAANTGQTWGQIAQNQCKAFSQLLRSQRLADGS